MNDSKFARRQNKLAHLANVYKKGDDQGITNSFLKSESFNFSTETQSPQKSPEKIEKTSKSLQNNISLASLGTKIDETDYSSLGTLEKKINQKIRSNLPPTGSNSTPLKSVLKTPTKFNKNFRKGPSTEQKSDQFIKSRQVFSPKDEEKENKSIECGIKKIEKWKFIKNLKIIFL